MSVRLMELLCYQGWNYPDSLWLGSFRLSASLCVTFRTKQDFASGCPLSGAERTSPSISSGCLVVGKALPSILVLPWPVMGMSTVNDFTLHMRSWLRSDRLTLFCGPSWLVNWSPAPCWHSDPNGRELLLSRHALTSLFPPPPSFITPPSWA